MFNKMNQLKAPVTNTSEASKGLELFGNWELLDELRDEELMAVVGGYKVVSGDYRSNVSILADFDFQGPEAEG